MAKLGRGIYYRKKEERYVGKCHAGRREDGGIKYAYVYGRTLAIVTEKLEAKRLEVANQRNMSIQRRLSFRVVVPFYFYFCLRRSKAINHHNLLQTGRKAYIADFRAYKAL